MSLLLFKESGEAEGSQGGEPITKKELIKILSDFQNDLLSQAFQFQAFQFERDSIDRLLSQMDEKDGLMIHFGKFNGYLTVALVPCDKDGNQKIAGDSEIVGEEDGTGHPPRKVKDLIVQLTSTNV